MSNVILAAFGTFVTMLVLTGFSVIQLQRMQDRQEFPGTRPSEARDPESEQSQVR